MLLYVIFSLCQSITNQNQAQNSSKKKKLVNEQEKQMLDLCASYNVCTIENSKLFLYTFHYPFFRTYIKNKKQKLDAFIIIIL